MDDFNDFDDMDEADDHYTNDSDYDIYAETNPPLGDSTLTGDENLTQENETGEPAIKIDIQDINSPANYEEILAGSGDSSAGEIGLSELYGDPKTDAQLWHQQAYPDTCAVVSQEFILEAYLERDFSEEELAFESMSRGYYMPGIGSYPEYVGNLLEDYGIEIERSHDNTIEDLTDKLSNNQKIIVAIDSNEIWTPSGEEQLKDLIYMPEANHAVMVTGYDDSTQTVYLNDPGDPNGAEMKVNLKDFENAWNDSSNFMVNTVNAPPKISA